MRNKARREAGLKVGDPREADHIKPLSEGGSNAKSNVRPISAIFCNALCQNLVHQVVQYA